MTQPMRSKTGKVAVVTGAARGLGLAFARRLAAEGATVVAIDRLATDGLVATLKADGAPAASAHQADLSDEERVGALEIALAEAGLAPDILVNNAGYCPFGLFDQISVADLRATFATNVESMFLMCKALVPGMRQRGYGRIVNITSDMLASTNKGFIHYMASKGAVIGLTRALANEVGSAGVTVNALAPGFTATPRTQEVSPDGALFDRIAAVTPINRRAVTDDIVGTMSFLASDDAAYMTGQTLVVNGGLFKAM